MPERWGIMPLDVLGNVRGPKYLQWVNTVPPPDRYNHPGLVVNKWTVMDFGAINWALVLVDADVATLQALAAEPDVFQIPLTLTNQQRNRAATFLENRGIPSEILPPVGATELQIVRRLAMVAQFYQAMHGESGEVQDGGRTLDQSPPQRIIDALQRRPRYASCRTTSIREMVADALTAWGDEPIHIRGRDI